MPHAHASTLLGELLELSKDHLRLTREENWDQWTLVLRKKKERYARLAQSGLAPDEAALKEIQDLEKQVMEMLEKKRAATRKELQQVARIRQTFSGYRKAGAAKPPRFGMDI